jgi:hypothetical protein
MTSGKSAELCDGPCLDKDRDSRRRPRGQLEDKGSAERLQCGFRSQVDNGQAGEFKRDQRDNLNDVVRSGAKGAIVIGLSGGMAMDNLNHAAHQDQRNANDPQQRCKGPACAQS